MHPIKKGRGGALLTALFIMTIVAIVATAMSTRLQLDIYRTRLIIIQDKLYLASQAVTFWAFDQLYDKTLMFTRVSKQGMVAQYPKNMGQLVSNIQINGGLIDLQARFNLNNLNEKKLVSVFFNLLAKTIPEMNNTDRTNLTQSVRDWISDYDLSKGKDSYTTYYTSQKPPYYPSHQLMASATELRLIQDVTPTQFQALASYIIVLPEVTPININTAPKKVLMSLGNGLNEAQANELIMARGETGIKDLKNIGELIKKLDLPGDQITIESKYFLNVAYVKSDEFKLTVFTLLKRKKNKQGKIGISVIRQSINGF